MSEAENPFELWLEKRKAERERKEAEEDAKPKIIPAQIVPGKFKFNLGEFVQDRLTGRKGYIVTRNEHLSGCVQYWLTNRGDGSQVTTDRIIDENHLERTGTPPMDLRKEDEAPGCVSVKL
jgi:hypothetical protein